MPVELIDIFGNISFFMAAMTFAMRDFILLRICAIISGVLGLIFFFFHDTEMLVAGVWEILFVLVNCVQLIILYVENARLKLNEEEKKLFEKIFFNLSAGEFKKILKLGKFSTFIEGEELIKKGEKVDHLVVISKGSVGIFVFEDQQAAQCKEFSFIGEMSFLTGSPAAASVKALEPTRCIMWVQKDLNNLLEHHPEIESKIHTIFSKDLIKKLKSIDHSGKQDTVEPQSSLA